MSLKVNRGGSAIVVVLGIIAVLMIMAVAFSVIMRTERSGTTNLRHNLNARNGLQTAISQALYDIDESIGDELVPKKWINGVMASSSSGGDEKYMILTNKQNNVLSILNEKSRKHLNPTSRALIRNANVDWKLIYGGVSLSNYANRNENGTPENGTPLVSDTIIGRFAYAAVNQTGYLDPNMVTYESDNAYCLPIETHQLKNNLYAYRPNSNKQIGFVDKNLPREDSLDHSFFSERTKENIKDPGPDPDKKGRLLGFTSFADLVRINDRLEPKMFINLFDPSNPESLDKNKGKGGRDRLFLPDIFGPTTFGMSPYPPQVERDSNEPHADVVLTEAVKIDGKTELTEDDLIKVYVAFLNMFSRENWENPVTNVEWDFPRVGQMRNILTRADLALLSFVEYYAYKESGEVAAKNKYLDMAIEIINDNGNPIYNKTYSFDGEELEGYLNAPCFKSVPMLTTVLGWTDRPALEPKKLYHHDGGGEFSEVSDDAKIEPEKTTAKYYAKYELPVHLMLWAVNPYGRNAPELDGATMNASIKFGENLDGTELFKHINGDDEIKGDPKIIVDPDKTFEESVADPITLSGGGKKNSIKIEKDLDEVITVYVQCPKIEKSTEENPLFISDIKKLYSWEKAGFGKNLKDYSIDVFLTVNIKAGKKIVQAVPAPRIGRGKVDNLESYIHFKLPLFRDNAQKKEIHRIGYAMPIDQRFAYATECMNEFREGKLESFPYWVNNAMAEDLDKFAELKNFEEDLNDADEFTQTSNLALDPTNPYAKLAMGFGADSDSEFKGPDFWNGLMEYDSTGLDFGKPYPDTLHIIPGSDTYLANTEYDKDDFEVDWGAKGIESIGELGMLCIGPWETISLFSTETPNGRIDFHTVFDYFTLDEPSKLLTGKVNLNAPPLLGTHPESYRHIKLAMDFDSGKNENFDGDGSGSSRDYNLDMGNNKSVTPREYVDKTNGINPEPLMAVIYGLGFDYNTSWEIASRILNQNIDYGSKEGITCFKDISQLGYSQEYDSLLQYLIDNVEQFANDNRDFYSDFEREKLLGDIAKYVTTRGQTFTIAIRSDAFTPKYGSDVDGTTLASKVAIVEAWRDTEPARDKDGNIITDKSGKSIHNWHIRSVRIID